LAPNHRHLIAVPADRRATTPFSIARKNVETTRPRDHGNESQNREAKGVKCCVPGLCLSPEFVKARGVKYCIPGLCQDITHLFAVGDGGYIWQFQVDVPGCFR
jgi:hypothetical protein